VLFLLDSLVLDESSRVDDESFRAAELSPVVERFDVLVEVELWLVDDDEPDAGVRFDNM